MNFEQKPAIELQTFVYLFPTPALSGSGSTGLISGIVFW